MTGINDTPDKMVPKDTNNLTTLLKKTLIKVYWLTKAAIFLRSGGINSFWLEQLLIYFLFKLDGWIFFAIDNITGYVQTIMTLEKLCHTVVDEVKAKQLFELISQRTLISLQSWLKALKQILRKNSSSHKFEIMKWTRRILLQLWPQFLRFYISYLVHSKTSQVTSTVKVR